MSDNAMRVLEEIEALLKAAPKGPWKWTSDGLHATRYPFPRTSDGMWLISSDCNQCGVPDDTTYEPIDESTGALIANAPAYLALLARLVRIAVDTTCSGATTGQACILEPSEVWCAPCRIRRELAGGVR